MNTKHSGITLTLISLLLPTLSLAEPPASEKRKGQHHQPPVEAFAACESKVESDSCEVITPRGDTINGVCQLPPNQSEMVCVPEGRMKRIK